MINYARTGECRSRFSAHYFGDENAKDCGICDNCLAKRKNDISSEEFEKISGLIITHLSQSRLTTMQLMDHLRSIRREKAWNVLRFLQSENKISVDDRGMLHVKGK
jgi:ATP-dependent DNA helicase RecQ